MENIVNGIYDIVWSPALVVLLVFAGLFFTIKTRCVQVRRLPEMVKLLFGRGKKGKDSIGITSFQAFCLSLSGRVGTGNIVGVATAIAIGGPGAVFWMWVIAFLGASTAFMESTLAQKHKEVHGGRMCGGPFFYIDHTLKQKWIGVMFALFCIFGYGLLLVSVQSNSVASAFEYSLGLKPIVTGVVLVVLLLVVIVGGVKRIANVASVVTPFMAVGYILMSLIIVAVNWRSVPDVFALIFKSAFGFGPAFGGMLGSAIAMGVKRGLFSNEAGQGGGAIASACADVEYPAQQGLVQAFSVYVDTLLVCTSTALMILCTGCYNVFDSTGAVLLENVPQLGTNYVSYTQAAIDSVFSDVGSLFVSIALAFFVFTTLMAYYFYSESSFYFLFVYKKARSRKFRRTVIWIYRILFFGMIVFGSCMTANTVWTIGDIGVGLTTWINVIVLLIICPQAMRCLNEYEDMLKKKKGKA